MTATYNVTEGYTVEDISLASIKIPVEYAQPPIEKVGLSNSELLELTMPPKEYDIMFEEWMDKDEDYICDIIFNHEDVVIKSLTEFCEESFRPEARIALQYLIESRVNF